MASFSEIRATARQVRGMAPGLTTGHKLTPHVREMLRTLARDCGLDGDLVYKANDADLISVYLVADKDAAGGQRVAQRIKLRLDDTLLGAPPAPRTPEPAPAPAPAPAPEPRTGAPGLDADAVARMISDAVTPVERAVVSTAADLRDHIVDVTLNVQKATLDMMRDTLHDAAHKAAVDALKLLTPTRLEVVTPTHPEPVNLGLVHRKTPQIISALSAGVNVYLHGPAGSGKTTVARKCAEAFSLQFYFAAKVESEYQLMGFKDAKGDTVRTPFREAYEHGGVFLFDEMDASSPSAVVALNAALANGICPFPDQTVSRHKDFLCIGAGNTKLTGANRQYAGRNQLDAASIDRFAFIEFDYDDDLERALASDAAWCAYVQSVRRAVAERGLPHLVTPRATYDGCKLLATGFDWDTVAGMVVFKGLDPDTRRQIEQAL